MMPSSLDPDSCFHELSLPDGRLIWDDRQQLLAWESPSATATVSRLATYSAVLSLDSFPHFEKASPDSITNVATALGRVWGGLSQLPVHPWRQVVGSFAFLLLRRSLKRADGDLRQMAEALLRSLGPDDEQSAWRARYDTDLTYEDRYRLVDGARRWFVEQYSQATTEGSSSPPDVPDKETREFYWWTVRCQYELASEWCSHQGYRNATARRKLVEASKAFLSLLKDEPRGRDLERFLRECGSDVEKEVKSVLFSSRGPSVSLRSNETVRRVFASWFLKRDDFLNAARLSSEEPERRRGIPFAVVAPILMTLVCVLFWGQTRFWRCSGPPPPENASPAASTKAPALKVAAPRPAGAASPRPSPSESAPATPNSKDWKYAFLLQLLIQIGMLVSLIAVKPELHRILVPRAFYASLLAWLTIIPAAAVEMHGSKMPHSQIKVGETFHDALQVHPMVSTFVVLPMLLLLFLFIWHQAAEVSQRTTRLKRTLGIIVVLYVGALFWGLIFGLPLKLLVEGQFEWEKFSELVHRPLIAANLFNVQPRCGCPCLLPILFIGSSIAVYFGVVVKLLWEDKSVSELLSEPL
jgi:hypothetical protein